MPIQIANYFLRKSFDSGTEITPMKLIKLVYIAHGWHLAIFDKPLLTEAVQAWRYGPVIPSIYHTFKKYGTEPIGSLYSTVRAGESNTPIITDKDVQELLDKVWDEYSHKSAYELSNLTHQKGTPWYYTWNEKDGKNERGVHISDKLIETHYLEKINVSRGRKDPATAG